MVNSYLVLAMASVIALLAGIWFGYRNGKSSAATLADQREEEFRREVAEAREREIEARSRESALTHELVKQSEELKRVLEDRGKFASEAARLDEAKKNLSDKEQQIASLHERVTVLEREKTEAIGSAAAANQRAVDLIAKEREAQAAVLAAKDDQIARLNEFIARARETLSTEFKALSADALQQASAQLIKTADSIIEKHGEKTAGDVELHRQHIQNLLQPVEETIKRLDKHVEESDQARSRAEALLDDQVKRLAGASESLTNALRKPVVRGSWGEMTLENALENAGLEPEIDFVLQHETDGEDGRRRTDALINLPKGRKLVIDSKNLMESYIALMSAEDEAQRAILAEAHSRSLRIHIRSLSSKEYWQRYEGLDCVILFIPHDGMYHAAIQDEAELIREACERRVFVANPMSLIPLLKAVRYVLDQERLNNNAEEIKKVGSELYSEVTRFAVNMATIGDRLRSTVAAYNDAVPGLDRFIVSKSRKLKQLGSAKGPEPELPEEVDLEPKLFASKELRGIDVGEASLMFAATGEDPVAPE